MLDYSTLKTMTPAERAAALDAEYWRTFPPEIKALFACLDYLAQRPGFGSPDEFWRRLMQPRPRPNTTGLPKMRDGQVLQ